MSTEARISFAELSAITQWSSAAIVEKAALMIGEGRAGTAATILEHALKEKTYFGERVSLSLALAEALIVNGRDPQALERLRAITGEWMKLPGAAADIEQGQTLLKGLQNIAGRLPEASTLAETIDEKMKRWGEGPLTVEEVQQILRKNGQEMDRRRRDEHKRRGAVRGSIHRFYRHNEGARGFGRSGNGSLTPGG